MEGTTFDPTVGHVHGLTNLDRNLEVCLSRDVITDCMHVWPTSRVGLIVHCHALLFLKKCMPAQ